MCLPLTEGSNQKYASETSLCCAHDHAELTNASERTTESGRAGYVTQIEGQLFMLSNDIQAMSSTHGGANESLREHTELGVSRIVFRVRHTSSLSGAILVRSQTL